MASSALLWHEHRPATLMAKASGQTLPGVTCWSLVTEQKHIAYSYVPAIGQPADNKCNAFQKGNRGHHVAADSMRYASQVAYCPCMMSPLPVQVLNSCGDTANAHDIPTHFPWIKLVSLYDQHKTEAEVAGDIVDWSLVHPDGSLDRAHEALLAHLTHRQSDGRRYWQGLNTYTTVLESTTCSTETAV